MLYVFQMSVVGHTLTRFRENPRLYFILWMLVEMYERNL